MVARHCLCYMGSATIADELNVRTTYSPLVPLMLLLESLYKFSRMLMKGSFCIAVNMEQVLKRTGFLKQCGILKYMLEDC